MKCQICGQREAATYVKHCVDRHVSEWFVCSECAYRSGLVSSFDGGFLDGCWTSPSVKKPHAARVNCPLCSASLQDILQNGRLGCPSCYATFYDDLLPSLRRMHGNLPHNGKIPLHMQRTAKSELSDLKKELEEAIKAQEYERCAALRDRIREQEGGAV